MVSEKNAKIKNDCYDRVLFQIASYRLYSDTAFIQMFAMHQQNSLNKSTYSVILLINRDVLVDATIIIRFK